MEELVVTGMMRQNETSRKLDFVSGCTQPLHTVSMFFLYSNSQDTQQVLKGVLLIWDLTNRLIPRNQD